MSEFSVRPEFDEMMKAIFDMPGPEETFVSSLREQFVTTGAANAQKSSYTGRKQAYRITPRMAWGLVLGLTLIVVVLASTSPTAATAMKRLLKYIPGIGSIEQSTSLRMLAEPVRVQRENAAVTVEQLVAGSERTVVVYRHIEPAVDYEQYIPPSEYKADRPELILPDGSKLDVRFGRHMPSDGKGILYALEFGPIPSGVTELTLSLTRLAGLPPGAGPEDWAIPLKLKPAPEGTGYPVIELPEAIPTQPSPAGEKTESSVIAAEYGISLAIDKYVESPDGYILEGSLRWKDASISEFGVTPLKILLLDADGNEVPREDTLPDTMPTLGSKQYNWAYKLTGKDFAWPLTFLVEAVEVRFPVNAKFKFDPGPNPQADRIVDLNLDLPAGDVVVYVDSVKILEHSDGTAALEFAIRSDDPRVIGASLIDLEDMSGGGGGGVPRIPEGNAFTSTIYYENGLPSSPITVSLTDIALLVKGPWQVTWDPAVNP
jgi:hypothetical protein